MAKEMSGFAKAFTDARKKLGAGKTFTYNGKSYSTNRADDKPAKAAAKPAGMASSPRPMAKPMAASPMPKPRPAEAMAAAGGARKPNADGIYSPTTEMRMRNAQPAAMPASPMPKPKPAGMTSPRPMARSAEMMAANGGVRKANANRKYSPTEEMRLRNAKKER